MKNQLKKAGVYATRIEAQQLEGSGTLGIVRPVCGVLEQNITSNGRPIEQIARYLSHVKCLQFAVRNYCTSIMVLEDTAIIPEDITKRVISLPYGVDIVYLNGSPDGSIEIYSDETDDPVYTVEKHSECVGYIVIGLHKMVGIIRSMMKILTSPKVTDGSLDMYGLRYVLKSCTVIPSWIGSTPMQEVTQLVILFYLFIFFFFDNLANVSVCVKGK